MPMRFDICQCGAREMSVLIKQKVAEGTSYIISAAFRFVVTLFS